MNSIDRAKQILQKCEEDLSKLGAETLLARDYDAAGRIADLAQDLGRLAAGLAPALAPRASAEPAVSADVRRSASSRRRPSDEYPKFFRKGDDLMKVGWSKKEKAEYVHKASKAALLAVAAAVAKLGQSGKLFTAEALLAAAGRDQGEPVPPYQTYLCLAWLRREGLVDRRGRDGYVLTPDSDLAGETASLWQALRSWQDR